MESSTGSRIDGIPSRRLAKEEAMAERQDDGSDHEEGGEGQGGVVDVIGFVGVLCFYVNRGRLRNIFCMFMACLRRLTDQIRHSCDQDKQAHSTELAQNMNQAEKVHDSRTVWQGARDFTGTAQGPRGW